MSFSWRGGKKWFTFETESAFSNSALILNVTKQIDPVTSSIPKNKLVTCLILILILGFCSLATRYVFMDSQELCDSDIMDSNELWVWNTLTSVSLHLILRACSIVSGKFVSLVSGSKLAVTPATEATTPVIQIGSGNQ